MWTNLFHFFDCEPTFAAGIDVDFMGALRKGSFPDISNDIEENHNRESEVYF